jgi:hypothetical protein
MTLEQSIAGLIFQVSVALAGVLLVFIGFVFTRAESFTTKRGDVYRNVARAGIAPFGLALLSAWLSLNFMQGSAIAYDPAVVLFRATVIVTGLYAAVVLFMYL